MRKKAHLEDRMDAQRSRLAAEPEALRGVWRSAWGDYPELYVEIGCGKGKFTVETALQHPDTLFAAIERVPDAMITAMERAQAAGADNVCFLDADAAKLTDYFAEGEVSRIYLNFSDPWPSQRQAKRRLTHPDFLRKYAHVLRPGGEIHFKTDNADLFEWSLFQFPKAGFTLSEVTRHLHENGPQGEMTDYEEKFYAQGKPINRCVATRGDTLSARLALDWGEDGAFRLVCADGIPVGEGRVSRQGEADLLIYPEHRRRGYGTEAAALLLSRYREGLSFDAGEPAALRTLAHFHPLPVQEDPGRRRVSLF